MMIWWWYWNCFGLLVFAYSIRIFIYIHRYEIMSFVLLVFIIHDSLWLPLVRRSSSHQGHGHAVMSCMFFDNVSEGDHEQLLLLKYNELSANEQLSFSNQQFLQQILFTIAIILCTMYDVWETTEQTFSPQKTLLACKVLSWPHPIR